MRPGSWILPLAVAGSVLAGARSARAQANYRPTPVGGRTTLVGGTGVVYGSDGAAAFLNPATVVRVDRGRLTFSVNFYSLSVQTSPRWYVPADVDRERFGTLPTADAAMTQFGFNSLPSSLCLFLRAADIGILARSAQADLRERGARIGVCFATVQSYEFAFAAENYARTAATGWTRQGQTVTESFSRFAAGPTYAMNIDDHWAIGASLHASLVTFRSLLAADSMTHVNGQTPIRTSFYAASRGLSFQANASAGITYRFRRQTLGLAVESPSFHVYGSGGANRATHSEVDTSSDRLLIAEGTFRANSPPRISLGTGVETGWGSAELNVSAWLPVSEAFRADFEGTRSEVDENKVRESPTTLSSTGRTRGVVNFAAGGEVFVSPRISILGGAGTDLSALPVGARRSEVSYFPVRQNRVYASIGVGSHGPGGDLLVGTELSYAYGSRVAVNSYQLPPELVSTTHGAFSVVFVVSGSTNINAIKRAVKDVTDVLKPDDSKKNPSPE